MYAFKWSPFAQSYAYLGKIYLGSDAGHYGTGYICAIILYVQEKAWIGRRASIDYQSQSQSQRDGMLEQPICPKGRSGAEV